MKSRVQKEEELKKGRELLKKSRLLIFADFSKVPAEFLSEFRREMKKSNANLLVIKKRLLNILLKKGEFDFDVRRFKTSVGTIFSTEDLEKISAPISKFFLSLGTDTKAKKESLQKILGGFDLKENDFVDAEKILFIGQLPPREVLLARLAGTLAAPLQMFLFLLNEKSKLTAK